MTILGIETSCDDTALALYHPARGVMGELIGSQVDVHAPFGGVVPELASRDHLRQILPLYERLLADAGLSPSDLTGVAYTAGPGLFGAVMVGAAFGRALAYGLNIPSIGVHHIEGHLLSAMLEPDNQPAWPFVALIVSGGHTLLVEARAIGDYHILGQSLDDAAGEAFDKTAKLLGLGYPGGPAIEALAKQGKPRFELPLPMVNRPGLDFSFSGLKTHVANTWAGCAQTDDDRADLAYALQASIAATLAIKAKRALQHTGFKQLVLVGGVSANQYLRTYLEDYLAKIDATVFFPALKHSTDNGAMIAYAGYQRLQAGQQDADLKINARARWSLEDVPVISN